MTRSRGPTPVAGTVPVARTRRTLPQTLVYVGWALILFRPDWWLAAHGLTLPKVPLLITACVLVALAMNPPQRGWNLPVLSFVLLIGVTLPLAYNIGFARDSLVEVIVYYVLTLGAITFLRTPNDAWPLLWMIFLGQFAWFEAFAGLKGRVPWHGTLANYDGYGPYMAIGLGLTFYLGVAATNRRLRMWAFAIGGLALMGVVASFARAAVLAVIAVIGWAWLRSPNKGRATAGIAIGSIVVLITAAALSDQARGGDPDSPQGFWNEMATMGQGTQDGTFIDRQEIAKAAWSVFNERPVYGAGAGNFGPAAAAIVQPGQLLGPYGENPSKLYDKALHDTHLQILPELGVLGGIIYLWFYIDFWRRNAKLRSARYQDTWASLPGGDRLSLRWLAVGLEAGLIGFIVSGLFYNQLFADPWLWSILAANLLLHTIVIRSGQAPGAARRMRSQ